jgi:hypothetical protein
MMFHFLFFHTESRKIAQLISHKFHLQMKASRDKNPNIKCSLYPPNYTPAINNSTKNRGFQPIQKTIAYCRLEYVSLEYPNQKKGITGIKCFSKSFLRSSERSSEHQNDEDGCCNIEPY